MIVHHSDEMRSAGDATFALRGTMDAGFSRFPGGCE